MEDSQVIAFMCHESLMERMDEFSTSTHIPRTRFIIKAVEIFTKVVKARGGFVVPLYSGGSFLERMNLVPEEEPQEIRAPKQPRKPRQKKAEATATSEPKRRGRPRKNPPVETTEAASSPAPGAKRRGRPRKKPLDEAAGS